MEKIPVYMNWSGGKDSAMALESLKKDPRFEIRCLLTTLSTAYHRVSMHGVRETLLDLQAQSLRLPLKKLFIPENASMEDYSRVMESALLDLKAEGITHAAFGDIFLEDLRAWREKQLSALSLKAVFPIWGRDTGELAREFINQGFRAVLVCVNSRWLDRSFAGRMFDEAFLTSLPGEVDPCGENGEFHSFVFDGPLFEEPLVIRTGEVVERAYSSTGHEENRFYFCDLEPGKMKTAP